MWSRQRCNHSMPPKKNSADVIVSNKVLKPIFTPLAWCVLYAFTFQKWGPLSVLGSLLFAHMNGCLLTDFLWRIKNRIALCVAREEEINTNQGCSFFSFRFCPHSQCPLLLTCRAWKSQHSGHWYYAISPAQLRFSTNNILSLNTHIHIHNFYSVLSTLLWETRKIKNLTITDPVCTACYKSTQMWSSLAKF